MNYSVLFNIEDTHIQRLNLGDEIYFLKIGEILFGLAEIPETRIEENLKKLSHALYEQKPDNRNGYIELLTGIFSSFEIPWQRKLFEILPLARTLDAVNERFEKVAFTKAEQKEIFDKIKGMTDYRTNVLNENEERRMPEIRHTGNAVAGWNYWLGILYEGLEFDQLFYKESKGLTDLLKEIAEEHCLLLYQTLMELQRIKPEIQTCLDFWTENSEGQLSEKSWIRESLRRVTAVFDVDETQVKPNAYSCFSLSELSAIEFLYFKRSKHKIRKCALCGRQFLASSMRQRFCQNPNAEHDDKVCADVGPTLLYKERVEKDEVLSQYQKNYKTYNRWQNVAKRLANQLDNASDEEITAIKSEIDDKYNQWVAAAQETKEQWENGKLEQSEALKRLVLPKIQERSPTLYKIEMDLKEFKGN